MSHLKFVQILRHEHNEKVLHPQIRMKPQLKDFPQLKLSHVQRRVPQQNASI